MAREQNQKNPQKTGGDEERKQPRRRNRQMKVKGIGRIRKHELCPFTQKLAAMLDAGLPLIQCLAALAEQTEDPNYKKVVDDIRARVEGGDSFAEALSVYNQLFGDLYVNMVRAGEMGGGLGEVTARLASYMEASQELIRRVKSAMTYPIVVMVLATLLAIGMLVFIVPVFEGIFEDFGGKLPAPTQVLVNISHLIRDKAPLVIIAIGGTIYGLKRYKKTDQGAMNFDRMVLKAPVAGALIEKIALARMSRTFASLLRSGVPILKTMEIVSQATGNRYIGRALSACGDDIEGGTNIGVSLKKSGQFPPMVIHMISAGEKTGNIDGMLEKVADFYEDEVSNSLESLASMIEPLLMAFLGVVIGGIVICMFLPIFKMHEVVS
jgi:type IV pilus assembly protein PilC